MLTEQTLLRSFRDGLDTAAQVRARRPNKLYQIELPAFMGDGDGVQIYVESGDGEKVVMTDLGATCMRISYTTKITKDVESQLVKLADPQGFSYADGEFRAEIPLTELMPAALGLLQIQAQAEHWVARAAKRTRESAEFRGEVQRFLRELFGESVETPFIKRSIDPHGDYPIDALIHTKRPLAITFPANDLGAERSVVSKLKLHASLPQARWVAIPRDLERLSSHTRSRLVRDYIPLGSSFAKDRSIIKEKVLDFSA